MRLVKYTAQRLLLSTIGSISFGLSSPAHTTCSNSALHGQWGTIIRPTISATRTVPAFQFRCVESSGGDGGFSRFGNVAYYDQYYFNSLFEHFVFPDGNAPHWESLSWLQKRFMKWFNKERTKAVLTFPVETMALTDQKDRRLDSDKDNW